MKKKTLVAILFLVGTVSFCAGVAVAMSVTVIPREAVTVLNLRKIEKVAKELWNSEGRVPDDIGTLAARGGFGPGELKDGWGNEMSFSTTADGRTVVVESSGVARGLEADTIQYRFVNVFRLDTGGLKAKP